MLYGQDDGSRSRQTGRTGVPPVSAPIAVSQVPASRCNRAPESLDDISMLQRAARPDDDGTPVMGSLHTPASQNSHETAAAHQTITSQRPNHGLRTRSRIGTPSPAAAAGPRIGCAVHPPLAALSAQDWAPMKHQRSVA
ncbi:hypothetical protein H112_02692 [Trichophyton rubrum D6]|uniref:Uncharacterized protein n=1 Tax=Trichophyton soudanense CBS 452.61 TaxID=1215331 RepID=A0A022XZL2_TRISD|nr:hypothetical protein H100_02698 [Trichophyton rubrum MR850]EZF43914.1 hypothetical protein H102_02690 [Trichophyton rubrum CBS 100081]EZF65318.1 hypothetical protein H104_02681 [Trichophyton rubrum CBS 289.86]EZF75741.1 hypothetical protein H105_02707 [Trichophyton soudanense CBS 452.61]EZF86469.1 hypothetical protein H110_02699 [Trichophyton rubrum MR1448]EZG18773.1 hypothetical protein H107_02777 [Trichophyton rubrum CBS 202.88]KDB35680.1 hypothetical protein H112_02692 [Trichophyton rub